MRIDPPVALAGLLFPGLALGYAYNPVYWTWQQHPIEDPFTLDPDSFPSSTGSASEIEGAIVNAMASWNDIGVDATLDYEGRGTGVLEADGHFDLLYSSDYEVGEGTLAFTGAWAWDDGMAFDCDIVFIARNDYGSIDWSADPSGPGSGETDLEAVALHELGHCLGMGHSESKDAVMYAYYQGYRELDSDDIQGITDRFEPPCSDSDGDGFADCDGDCDDGDASVHPDAEEVCDGLDNDCDGVIDAHEEETVSFGLLTSSSGLGWGHVANILYVERDTGLQRFRQHMSLPEDTRLVWTVHTATREDGPWTLVRSLRTLSDGSGLPESPELGIALEAGSYVMLGLGGMSETQTFWYDSGPKLETQGPITPVGGSYGRVMGDESGSPDASFLAEQEIDFIADPDPDGDGATALCGDCDPDDASVTGEAESCDGADNDCDGAVDEDFDSDADGDGAIDCLDDCPDDPDDDADGDGLCADVDPCPNDPDDACGDSGLSSSDTGEAGGKGCSCASGGEATPLTPMLLGLALLARRRRGGATQREG